MTTYHFRNYLVCADPVLGVIFNPNCARKSLSVRVCDLGAAPSTQIPCKREFVFSTFSTVRVGEMIQNQCFGVFAGSSGIQFAQQIHLPLPNRIALPPVQGFRH